MANEKIEPCPRCGSLCTVGQRGTDNPEYPPDLHFRLECQGKKCGYGLEGDTEAEAIAAHNRVSRANAIADSYAGLFEKAESFFVWSAERRKDFSMGDKHHPDESIDPMFQEYNKVIEAEDPDGKVKL